MRKVLIMSMLLSMGLFCVCCSSDDNEKEPVPGDATCYSGKVQTSDQGLEMAVVQIESVPSITNFDRIDVGEVIVAIFPDGTPVTYKNGDIIDFHILSCERYTSIVTDDKLPPSFICDIELCK